MSIVQIRCQKNIRDYMKSRLKIADFTVLISTYHKETVSNFNECMTSIWDCQNLKPNQIILVKDGPLTTALEMAIKTWEKKLPEVLLVTTLSKNQGLGRALNHGLKLSDNELVARMDTDDICLPDRFEKQITLMQKHPSVSCSSCSVVEFDDDLNNRMVRRLPINHDEIIQFAKFRNPINHSGAIFCKSDVLAAGGYPDIYPEDYMLWIKMIENGCIFQNESKVLVRMRTGLSFLNRRGFRFFLGELKTLIYMYRINFINIVELSLNVLVRLTYRNLPRSIKKHLYILLREKNN